MHEDDGTSAGSWPDEVEFLDLGPSRRHRDVATFRRRWPRRLPLALAGVVAAALIVAVMHTNGTPSASSTTAANSPSPEADPPSVRGIEAEVPAVVVFDVGHPLLGGQAGWELFARGDGDLVRIEPALGRVWRTPVPTLQSSGPVSFVVGADQAIIRPLDYVPGYVIQDEQPARPGPDLLGQGGPLFPGPDPRHFWAQSGDNVNAVMVLVDSDGRPTGARIPVPADSSPLRATADGAGYLLFAGVGGVYDARPGQLRRITTGALVAVGPAGWLTVECDSRHRCATVAVNRANDRHHRVGPAIETNAPPGAISPDGSTAAIFQVSRTGTATIALLDLASGRERPLEVSIDQQVESGTTIVWSPDSRLLLVADANGRLNVVDARTARVSSIGMPLPKLSQLAVRNLPG
ncbi:MAG: hypothetical protein ACRDWT_21240 [Jatrophihabitantaceae bacterium]